MRSKAPLALMERLIMVLVFALAAALCLQAFALADRMSERNAARDRAVMECQSAAEILKASNGDMAHALTEVANKMNGSGAQGLVQIGYDADWNRLPPEASVDFVYVVELQGVPTDVEGLWRANIWAAAMEDIRVGGSGELLFQMDVAWQKEVASRG